MTRQLSRKVSHTETGSCTFVEEPVSVCETLRESCRVMRERPDDLERVLGRGLSRVNLVGRLAEKQVPQCSQQECGCKRPTGQPHCNRRAAYYCIRGRGWRGRGCSRA